MIEGSVTYVLTDQRISAIGIYGYRQWKKNRPEQDTGNILYNFPRISLIERVIGNIPM